MNQVNVMGRLTKDVELRYSQGAEPIAIARFTVAINRRYSTDKEQKTDFINCIAFGKQAEFISKYFSKGKMIAISGELRTNSWEDKDTGKKRYSTEVFCEKVSFCGGSKENNAEDLKYCDIEEVPDDDNLPF